MHLLSYHAIHDAKNPAILSICIIIGRPRRKSSTRGSSGLGKSLLACSSVLQYNAIKCTAKTPTLIKPLTCVLCTKEVGIIEPSHGKCQRIVSTSQHNHRLFTIHSLFLRQSIKHSLIHQSTTHLPTLSPTHSLTRSLTTIQSPDFIASPTLSLLPACMHTYIITHPNKSRCLIPT